VTLYISHNYKVALDPWSISVSDRVKFFSSLVEKDIANGVAFLKYRIILGKMI